MRLSPFFHRNKLRDPRLMYNPKAVKDILQDWVNKLHEIFDKFTQQCISDWKTGHQGREISDREFSVLKVLSRDEFFFCLGAAFSEVSNVSMLCFETDTYPSQCDQISGVELTLLKQDSSLEEIRSKAVELKSDIAEKFKTMKDTKTPAKFDDCVVTDSEKANAAGTLI